jgi:hypothetical protein
MFLRDGADMAFKVKRPPDPLRGKASSVTAAMRRHDTIPARCERPRSRTQELLRLARSI